MRSLRLLVAVTVAGLAPSAALAQWPTAPTYSIDIGLGTAVAAASDGRYGLLVLWHNGTTLTAQRVNPIAAPMWGAGVDLTSDFATAGVQVVGSATDDSMRGGYFAWANAALQVRLTRVAASSTKVFDGILVSPSGKACHSPRLLRMGAGVLVIYVNDSDGAQSFDGKIAAVIELALVASDGTVMKRAQLTAMHPEGQLRAFADGSGGAIIVWDVPPYVDSARDMPGPTATWGVRVDANLVSVWERIDDDPIYARRANTASVAPDGQGGLWVAGRRNYGDADVYSVADNGEYVMVNRVTATGANAWNSWVKALEWDCHEKREYYVVGIEATETDPAQYFPASNETFFGPDQDADETTDDALYYLTDQHTPRLVADGSGGVYVLVKDSRMLDLGGALPADEHLYAQHLSSSGVRAWDANQTGMYFSGTTVDPSSGLNAPLYETDYGWKEGAEVRRNTNLKQQPIAESRSWTAYDTFEGEILNEPFVSVWAEDVAGTWNVYAVELDPAGDMQAAWGGPPITVKPNVGDQSEGGTGIFTVSHERFGTYVVWTNGSTVQAAHLNFFEMWDLWRVDYAVGPGPDIFAPPPVTDLQAAPYPGMVELTWTNPTVGVNANKPFDDFDGVLIIRTTDGPALSPYDFPEDSWRDAGPTELYRDYSVEIGVTYYYTAFAYDTEFAALNFSTPVWTSVRVGLGDVENFQAYGAGSDTIELSWTNPDSEDYAGVEIWRDTAGYPTDPTATPSGDLQIVARVLVDDADPESWTDAGLAAKTLYYYSAFPLDDPAGTPFATLGARAAAAPVGGVTGFTADGQDAAVSVMWDNPTVDPSPNGTFEGVVICRLTGSEPPASPDDGQVDFVAGTIGTDGAYPDEGLTNGTEYTYAAFAAYDFGGVLVYAVPGTASATPVDDTAPDPITNFLADNQVTPGLIYLSWALPDLLLERNQDLWGFVITRKLGSPPTNPDDGDIVVFEVEALDPPGIITLVPDWHSLATEDLEDIQLAWRPGAFSTEWYDLDPLVVDDDLYYYAAWTFDEPPSLNLSTITVATPALPAVSDLDPEIVQGPTSAAGYDSATITWRARDYEGDMTAVVRWGLDATALLPGHEIRWVSSASMDCPNNIQMNYPISGLKSGATYVYEVTVTDSAGQTATEQGIPFTTAAPPGDEGDGLPTAWEDFYDTDPANPLDSTMVDSGSSGSLDDDEEDFDGDGLRNILEYWFGGNPHVADTDGDGFTDYEEAMSGLNPAVSYWEEVQGGPLSEEGGGCAAGGRALPAWALVFVVAAFALTLAVMRRRASAAR